MKTTVRPISHPDTGETVFRWEIRKGRRIVAGGYGATEQDAKNDVCNRVVSAREALRSYRAHQTAAQRQYDAICEQVLRSVAALSK